MTGFSKVHWRVGSLCCIMNSGVFSKSIPLLNMVQAWQPFMIMALADPGGDQFLSFSHTFLLKSVCVRGYLPPQQVSAPPTGNPGSATEWESKTIKVYFTLTWLTLHKNCCTFHALSLWSSQAVGTTPASVTRYMSCKIKIILDVK